MREQLPSPAGRAISEFVYKESLPAPPENDAPPEQPAAAVVDAKTKPVESR